MKSYDPDIETQLDAASLRYRDGVLFILPEGNFGFFSGGRGTVHDPITNDKYVGAGGLLDFAIPVDATDGSSSPIEISLASRYQIDGVIYDIFDNGILATVESSNWLRKPAIIVRLWFDADSAIIEVEQRSVREIHAIDHIEDPVAGYIIKGTLETYSVFQKLVDGKKRNPTLQYQLDPTDKFLDNVSTVTTQKTYWGSLPPSTPVLGHAP